MSAGGALLHFAELMGRTDGWCGFHGFVVSGWSSEKNQGVFVKECAKH
jgi:hypothetical protein